MKSRLAVLVDGDNIGGGHGPKILAISGELGNPAVVRVYANARRACEWHEATGFRMIHAGTGKNASDMLLAIDAIELALSGRVENFVIASSDGDFTHLTQRLREYGATVTGIGEAKTPSSFRGTCSSFVALEAGQPLKVVSSLAPEATDLDLKIRAMIAANSKNGAGMRIAALGPRMHALHGTRISALPERTWRAYLSARPGLYDLDPRGPDAMVRFRTKGFSAVA